MRLNIHDSPSDALRRMYNFRKVYDTKPIDLRKRTGCKRVRMFYPRIRGNTIKSIEHLMKVISSDYPGIRNIDTFSELMSDASTHFSLIDRLEGKTELKQGEFAQIIKDIDKPRSTLAAWTFKERPPKIYLILEGTLPKSEAQKLFKAITKRNDGLNQTEAIQSRLDSYYAANEYRNSKNYPKDMEMICKYFSFWDAIQQGMPLSVAARNIGICFSDGKRWVEGHVPWMMKLARSIPSRPPREGNLWLPLTTGEKMNPKDFIEVPLKITSLQDIRDVLSQLKPRNDLQMNEWRERFGESDILDSFMYSLGSLISDGKTQFASDACLAGSRPAIGLGKTYDWSVEYGEGTCYHYGKIGITMSRIKDQDEVSDKSFPSDGQYRWQGQRSTLLTWLRRTGLGFNDTESKTYHPLNADWILKMPERERVSFLQGVCDGDGCVSLASQYLSIGTCSNSEFYRRLLHSLGMTSHLGDGAVVVSAHESLQRARDLRVFRYARNRLAKLEKLGAMIDSFDINREMDCSMREYAKSLRKHRESWGAISEHIFDRFGYTWPYYTIKRRLCRIDNQ